MFLAERFESEPGLVSERKEEKRKRIFANAMKDWAAASADTKKQYSLTAKTLNNKAETIETETLTQTVQCRSQAGKRKKRGQGEAATGQSTLAPNSAAGQGGQDQNSDSGFHHGIGLWGLGDLDWGISLEILNGESKAESFVANNHSKWLQTQDSPVQATELLEETPEKNNLLDITFCQRLGGCYHGLPGNEQQQVLRNIDLVRNVAREHRKLIAACPAGLLLVGNLEEGAGFKLETPALEVYFVCNVFLKPLEATLWRCKCDRRIWALDSKPPGEISCELEFRNHWDHAGSTCLRTPMLFSMHQFAFEHRSIGNDFLRCKLLFDYKVTSLCTFTIPDVGLFRASDDLLTATVPPCLLETKSTCERSVPSHSVVNEVKQMNSGKKGSGSGAAATKPKARSGKRAAPTVDGPGSKPGAQPKKRPRKEAKAKAKGKLRPKPRSKTTTTSLIPALAALMDGGSDGEGEQDAGSGNDDDGDLDPRFFQPARPSQFTSWFVFVNISLHFE